MFIKFDGSVTTEHYHDEYDDTVYFRQSEQNEDDNAFIIKWKKRVSGKRISELCSEEESKALDRRRSNLLIVRNNKKREKEEEEYKEHRERVLR